MSRDELVADLARIIRKCWDDEPNDERAAQMAATNVVVELVKLKLIPQDYF